MAIVAVLIAAFFLKPHPESRERPSNLGTVIYGRLGLFAHRTGRQGLKNWSAVHLMNAYDRALANAVKEGRVRKIECTVPETSNPHELNALVWDSAQRAKVDILNCDASRPPWIHFYVWTEDALSLEGILKSLHADTTNAIGLQ
jgi:hypothetical protein